MPMLPTIEVTQAQVDRLLAVFGSPAAYRKWLRETLVSHVAMVEGDAHRKGVEDDLDAVANPPTP